LKATDAPRPFIALLAAVASGRAAGASGRAAGGTRQVAGRLGELVRDGPLLRDGNDLLVTLTP
jgi:hypothetical protein